METKRHPKRGKNFTPMDDKNICIAWLAISQDPLKARDQQGEIFWKDVQEHAILKNRNWDAVRQRFGYISRSVAKFVECYDFILKQRDARASLEDLYNDAVKLYHTDSNTRTWKFYECWETLRHNPKFITFHETRTEKKGSSIPSLIVSQQSPANVENLDFESNAGGNCFGDFTSTSEISIACNDENDFDQPNDWKKGKFYENQQELERRRVEALETLAVAAVRKNELLAEHTRALNAATEAKIITTTGENLDSLSIQILELKKTKILMELKCHDIKLDK